MSSGPSPTKTTSSDDQPGAGESSDCLKWLDRARANSDIIDPNWLFGGDDETQARHGDTPVNQAAPEFFATPQRMGRFQIVRRLGQGGYGVVFLATDPDLNRRIALKVPGPQVLLQPDLQARFLREGEAAAALSHPGIVTVYESGQVGTLLYIASEYVEGCTLAEWLERNDSVITPTDAATIVCSLAAAVQHAHSRGVLHRDIKPGNVLLECTSQTTPAAAEIARAVRLADFGLARVDDAISPRLDQTTAGQILGTPGYMSPEQADGRHRDVDSTTDVHALGVILYELLTGKPPFQRESLIDTLNAIRQDHAPRPSSLVAGIPRDLEAICLKCLQKDGAARYPTAAALADDLHGYLNHEPVSARRPTQREALRQWSRRNPRVAALSAVISLLLIVLAVGSTLAAFQINSSRQETLDSLEREILAKDRATNSEDLALRALYEARIGQARLLTQSKQMGQQVDSLRAVQSAAAMTERLQPGEKERLSLRNDAIAALGRIDLQPDRHWEPLTLPFESSATDATATHYAVIDPDSATITVRSMEDDHVVAELSQDGAGITVRDIVFSPDSSLLACTWLRSGKMSRVELWDMKRQQSLTKIVIPRTTSRPYDFSPDGSTLAVAQRDGSIAIVSLLDFSVTRSIPTEISPEIVRWNSDGSGIAICGSEQLHVFNAATGEKLFGGECSGTSLDISWSHDGLLLAVARNRSVSVWRTVAGKPLWNFGHPAGVLRVSFHPSLPLLMTYGIDRRTRIWDLTSWRIALTVSEESTHFSRDGKWLARPTGRWRVLAPQVHQAFRQPRLANSTLSSTGTVSLSADGRLVAASNRSQTVFWDIVRGEVVATLPTTQGSGVLSRSGHFIFSSLDGLGRRPVTRSETETEIVYEFGAEERLSNNGNCGFTDVSADGNVVVCVDRFNQLRTTVCSLRGGFTGILAPDHRYARWLDVSPDGSLLATGTWLGSGVRIWDLQTGTERQTLNAGSSRIRFSNDGSMLAVDEGARFSVWRTADWTPLIAPGPKERGSVEPCAIAFSPDNSVLAMLAGSNTIRLLGTEDFSELARLPLPDNSIVESLHFTDDGTRLVAGVRGVWSSLHVWDLQHLHTQLQEFDLDWPHPETKPRSDETKPLRIVF